MSTRYAQKWAMLVMWKRLRPEEVGIEEKRKLISLVLGVSSDE